MNQIWLSFLTGLTTGGISCLAVQGGFLTTSIADDAGTEQKLSGKLQKVSAFLIAKLVAYSLLGFALGALGSALKLTPQLLGWMQILAGVFMLLTAARLLDIHPIFRYFVIQPPKFVFKLLRNESKIKSVFTPAILGFSTVLIPCGVTQAMMALAVASGSSLAGAGIMFAFVLGTSPVFLTIGVAAMELLKRKSFSFAASLVIIALGLLAINTGQIVRGSVHTAQNYWEIVANIFGSKAANAQGLAFIKNGVQEVTINVRSGGYSSKTTQLKAGIPVRLTLASSNVQSCARSFLIPSLKISKILPQNGVSTIEFTPTSAGLLSYTCGMGMYTGKFEVIN